jgi:hypothetical protein
LFINMVARGEGDAAEPAHALDTTHKHSTISDLASIRGPC